MTQYDFGTIDTQESGPALAAQMQSARDAWNTHHKGPARPSYAQAGMLWVNDTGTPWVLTFFDGSDDIPICTVNASTNQVRFKTESLAFAASDETTALTTGTGKMAFRMPYGFTLTAIRASLTTAQTSGSIFTADVNESGVSILSTKLTIDNGEKTSTTAVTAAVISDSALADDAEITVDIDQVGDGTAKGLKITLIGYQTP